MEAYAIMRANGTSGTEATAATAAALADAKRQVDGTQATVQRVMRMHERQEALLLAQQRLSIFTLAAESARYEELLEQAQFRYAAATDQVSAHDKSILELEAEVARLTAHEKELKSASDSAAAEAAAAAADKDEQLSKCAAELASVKREMETKHTAHDQDLKRMRDELVSLHESELDKLRIAQAEAEASRQREAGAEAARMALEMQRAAERQAQHDATIAALGLAQAEQDRVHAAEIASLQKKLAGAHADMEALGIAKSRKTASRQVAAGGTAGGAPSAAPSASADGGGLLLADLGSFEDEDDEAALRRLQMELTVERMEAEKLRLSLEAKSGHLDMHHEAHELLDDLASARGHARFPLTYVGRPRAKSADSEATTGDGKPSTLGIGVQEPGEANGDDPLPPPVPPPVLSPSAAPLQAAAGSASSDDVAAMFARADIDNSGGIDVGELQKALRELGLAADMEQTRAMMNKYDTDRSGTLELPEFRQLVADAADPTALKATMDLAAAPLEPAPPAAAPSASVAAATPTATPLALAPSTAAPSTAAPSAAPATAPTAEMALPAAEAQSESAKDGGAPAASANAAAVASVSEG